MRNAAKQYKILLDTISSINDVLHEISKRDLIIRFLKTGQLIFESDFVMLFFKNNGPHKKDFFNYEIPSKYELILEKYIAGTYEQLVKNKIGNSKTRFISGISDTKFSILTIPLEKADGSLFGTLMFFSTSKKFTNIDLPLGKIFSKHLTDKIFLKQFSNEIQALTEINKSLVEAQDMNSTLSLIIKSLTNIFGCSFVHILRSISVIKSNDTLEIMESSDPELKRGTTFSSKEGFSGWIIDNNKFLLAQNLSPDTKEHICITEGGEQVLVKPKSFKFNEVDKCILGVPLRYKGLPIGAILIASTENSFAYDNKHDRELLLYFADLAAVAIENINNYLLKERRNEEILAQATLINPSAIAMSFVHDARHSLGNINAYISSLIKISPTAKEEDPKANTANALIAEVTKLTQLFSSLVRYARKDELLIQEHKIKDILDHMIYLMSIRLRNIKCKPEYIPKEAESIKIECDRAEIEQVLVNLFNNSIYALEEKYKERKGQIKILLQDKNDEFLYLVFEDDGVGILEKDIPSIFDLFFTTKTTGTGFGLAICKRIVVDHHQGSIEVTSEYGQRTTFRIRLKKHLAK
ncbi:MAG: ATP-binding protein [Bacteroidales bacterium]